MKKRAIFFLVFAVAAFCAATVFFYYREQSVSIRAYTKYNKIALGERLPDDIPFNNIVIEYNWSRTIESEYLTNRIVKSIDFVYHVDRNYLVFITIDRDSEEVISKKLMVFECNDYMHTLRHMMNSLISAPSITSRN